jgi:hypothetical protein
MSEENLKASAASFGFDPTWIEEVLNKWGPEVLATIVELARNGFSVTTIVEVLAKFGPLILEFLVNLLNRKKSMGLAGDVIPGEIVEGVDSAFIDIIVQKYLPMIIEKYLPMIMENYGPKIIQFIVDTILKNLQTK